MPIHFSFWQKLWIFWSFFFALLLADPKADIVFLNAMIYSMEPGTSITTPAEVIAIRAGKICGVGSKEKLAHWIGPQTRQIDVQGKTILPAFVDAHNHLIWSGTEREDLNLNGVNSPEELKEVLRQFAQSRPQETWIRGSGWEMTVFTETLATKECLDLAVPARPVFLTSSDGHSAWVNSKALEIAGMNQETPDPKNGRILRDPQGFPTGLLLEDAKELVEKHLPEYSQEQIDQGLQKALKEANQYGITTLFDPKTEPWMLEGYQRFEQQNKLSVRVRAALEVENATSIEEQIQRFKQLKQQFNSPHLQIFGAKFFIDGVIESKTALLNEPYIGGENGKSAFSDSFLEQAIIALDQAHFEIHAHTIGDGAVRQMLNAIEKMQQKMPHRDRRPQLVHLQLIHPNDLPRFSKLQVIANVQPLWAYPDSYITELTEPILGEERSQWLYPIGSLLQQGGKIVAGSDWSVTSMNPFEAIQIAVTRQDPEQPEGRILTPHHRVSVESIIRAYTSESAYALFLENETGSLQVGKWADLILLDQNPFQIHSHQLNQIKVLATFFEGKRVYTHSSVESLFTE